MKARTISAMAGAVLLAGTMQANAATEIQEDYGSYYDAPDATGMVMDAWIAKPLQTVMVAGGAVTWLVSLPFTLPTQTHDVSWQKLVAEPAGNLQRCLGCTDVQDKSRLAYEYRQAQQHSQQGYVADSQEDQEFEEW